jgi:hypothetical protein
MTRDELHAQIWSQPMRTVAKALGISDVALAKRCRSANIPVPPRGWWAKKSAGRPVKIRPLPRAPFVLRNYFPALESSKPAGTAHGPVKPRFRELAAVKHEIEEAIGSAKAPKNLSQPHPIIARLLQQDEARKKDQSHASWLSDYLGPKFVSEIQRRRLRFLCGLFAELERLGCKISGSTHAGEKFSIQVGSCREFLFCHLEKDPLPSQSRSSGPHLEQLQLDITEYNNDFSKPKRSWTDGETKLENQIPSIVTGFLIHVEQEMRASALRAYDWAVQNKATQQRDAELAVKRAEAELIAQQKANREAQIRALVEGAGAFETAERIRQYVAVTKQKYTSAHTEEIERWVSWALAHADGIDPLVSGKFLRDLNDFIPLREPH